MEALILCKFLRNLLMIDYNLEKLIASLSLMPGQNQNLLKSLIILESEVSDWAWETYNKLPIKETRPGFNDIDVTQENHETLFKKLELPEEFLDLVNPSYFFVNSLDLASSLNDIEHQMNHLSMDDRLIEFLYFTKDLSDELVKLLEESDQ